MGLQMNDLLKRSREELGELEKWLERNKELLSELEECERNKTKETENCSSEKSVKELLLSTDYEIGDLITCKEIGYEPDNECVYNAITSCRRKIKKKDIILFYINDDEGLCGTIFTEKKLYILEDGIKDKIEYADIDDVDFEDYHVYVTLSNGEKKNLDFEEDYYSKEMYNLLMDIKEYLEEE